jgi:hypothetical protein
MTARHDAALAGAAGGTRLPGQAPPRRRALARSPVAWLLGAVAALILVKTALYVAAAQPFGGAEQGLCQWDCEWYTHTIQDGYDPAPRLRLYHDSANWAFFPLYPLLGRLVLDVTGMDAFWSGTLVSLLCFAGFAVLSCRYRALTRGVQARDTTWLVLLAVYPFSLYYVIPYTESAYLLLTVLLLLAARTGNAAGAGLATGLLTATRPTGVLAIPYLLVERLWHARLALRPGLVLAERTRILADSAFPLALAPLGIVGYMAYLYWLTGDALAFSHVQLTWGRRFFNPVKIFYWAMAKNDWYRLLGPGTPATESYSAFFAIPAGIACLWLLARRRVLEAWLLGSSVVLALATSVTSLPRYVAANPVFLLAVGDLADRIGGRALRIGLVLACVAGQAFLLHSWLMQSTLGL